MALTMNAGGRELLFRFTVRAWVEIEEKLGSLNGRIALAYMRIRYSIGGDFGRTERQRKVVSQLIDKCRDLSLMELVGVYNAVSEGMQISLSPMQIKMANRLAKTALTIGMRREEAEQDDDEVIDVVLEELRQEELKKKEEAPSASAADSASATD